MSCHYCGRPIPAARHRPYCSLRCDQRHAWQGATPGGPPTAPNVLRPHPDSHQEHR